MLILKARLAFLEYFLVFEPDITCGRQSQRLECNLCEVGWKKNDS